MQRPLIFLALGIGIGIGSDASSTVSTSDKQPPTLEKSVILTLGAYRDAAETIIVETPPVMLPPGRSAVQPTYLNIVASNTGWPSCLRNREDCNESNYNEKDDQSRTDIILASAPIQISNVTTTSSTSIESLKKQARFWYGENRDDLAEEALTKLFRIAPDNLQGLQILAKIQIRRRQIDGITRTVERMRRENPDAPELADIEALLRADSTDRGAMQSIRQLARDGHPDDAAAAIQKLYPHGPPSEELTLEYWNFVASSRNGRPRARVGLQVLVHGAPENLKYRLALAELLTSKAPVDRQALAQIIALKDVPAHAKQARAAWRRAMLALEDSVTSIGLLRTYADQEQNDSAVKTRLYNMVITVDARRRLLADPSYQAQRNGIALLDANKIDAAQASLERAYVVRKSDVDLLNALGLLRLRQRRHAESVVFFSQAAKLDPPQRERWLRMMRVARYWELITQAETAIDGKRYALAEEALLQAQSIDPKQTAAPLALASLYSDQQRISDAELILESVLRAAPGNVDAIAKLANLYQQDGQEVKLQALIQSLTKVQQAAVMPGIDKAEATRLKNQADELVEKGRDGDAIAMLERAVQLDLEDPWLRFALAKLYVKRQRKGDETRGDDLFRTLLSRSPNDASALYAYALFQDNRGRTNDALVTLQNIPPLDRDLKVAQLQRRLLIDQKIRLMQTFFESGHIVEAHTALDQASAIAGNDTAFVLQLADGLSDIGVNDTEVEAVLQKIAASDALTPLTTDETTRLSDLRVNLLIRRVRVMLASGNKVAAQRLLQQQVESGNDSRRLQLVRAEVALTLDQFSEAEMRYRRLFERYPTDRDVSLGLIDTLIASGQTVPARILIDHQTGALSTGEAASLASRLIDLKDDDAALVLIEPALRTTPENSRLLGIAAQIAEHQNRPDQAIEYLQRSLAVDTLSRTPHRLPTTVSTDNQDIAAIRHSSNSHPTDGSIVGGGPYPRLQLEPGLAAAAVESGGDSYRHRKLADLLDQRSTWVASAVDTRSRSGSSGTSEYAYTEIPIELKRPWHDGGRVFAQAAIVKTSAGMIDLADSRDAAKFGSVLLCQPFCTTGATSQNASGVALAAGYERGGQRLDIGVTPLGFPVQNIVGGILHKGDLGPASYSIDASRRALGGSVLSYAGARDPRTGELWGGIVATGLRFGLSRDAGGTFGAWSSLGLHRLSGRNVQENDRMQLMGGTYWRLINETNRLFTAGVNGMLWRFSENAGEYTFGHGGYYSPQRFASIAFPLTYGRRTARLSYTVRATVSVSRSATAAADYFPTRADFQSQASSSSASNGVDPHYAALTGRGIGRSLAAAFEYQIDPRLFLGGRLEIDRSTDYAPNRVMFYFRYNIDRAAARPVQLPPEALIPVSQY